MKPSTLLPILLGVASVTAIAQLPALGPAQQSTPDIIDLRNPATSPSLNPTQPNTQDNTRSGNPAGMQSETPAPSSGQSNDTRITTQQSGTDSDMAQSEVSMIETKTEGGFTYACGGIGESEVARMKEMASDYDMMLTFATRKGEYLADVNVDIADAKGDAQLQTMCDAPIMLVDVPHQGTYRVHAEAGGYTLNKTTRVVSNRRNAEALVMHWPTQIGEMVEPAQTSTGSSGAVGTESQSSGESSDMDDSRRIEHPSGITEIITPMEEDAPAASQEAVPERGNAMLPQPGVTPTQ